MARGRRPDSSHLRLVKGNKRGDRRREGKATPTPPLGELVAPRGLSPAARAPFNDLVEALRGEARATPSHQKLVTATARKLAEIDELRRELREGVEVKLEDDELVTAIADSKRRRYGRVYETLSTQGEVVLKANPLVTMLHSAEAQLHRFLEALGLSPTSVAKAALPGQGGGKGGGNRCEGL